MAHQIKFYSWDGIEIDVETRKRWAADIAEKLEKGENGRGAYSLSGESMIAGFRFGDNIQLFDVIIRHRAEIRIGAPNVTFPDDKEE